MSNTKKLSRNVAIFLFFLCSAVVSTYVFAADDVSINTALNIGGLLISGVVLPMLYTFRKESREGVHNLRNQLHTDMTAHSTELLRIALSVAKLEERDRIAELLDKRLPQA